MIKFAVVYVTEGKEYREIVNLNENSRTSTTQAYNKFWRQVKKRGLNKNNASIKGIYLVS